MDTESMSPRFHGLDSWASADILDAFLEGQMAAVAAVRPALPALAAAAEAAVPRLARGGRLVYVGAGTSGRIAVQDGAELPPTFRWPPERLLLVMAGGEAALMRSIEGAEDDADAGAAALDAHGVGADDVVLVVAASGRTRFTLGALRRARAVGALAVGVANNAGTPLIAEADHGLLVETGAEVIAGSTRMKAGTAQKVVLNLFSSLVMVRLGHVYRGLMVDMEAMNEKLHRRAEGMLMELTGCDRAAARTALDACQGQVKTAVLVLHGQTPAGAEAALAQHQGQLRAALAALPPG